MNIILHDFHNLAFRCAFIPTTNIGNENAKPDYDVWRRTIFTSIYYSIQKNNANEVIIAVDSKLNWRKKVYPRYKEDRILNREKTNINWEELFTEFNNIITDLRTYLPFKVLQVKWCEADDIIASITKHALPSNRYIIISKDIDYSQLISDNVIVYDPINKKYLSTRPTDFDDYFYLGQKKDSIPNVLTPNDYPLITEDNKKKRKPTISKKRLNEMRGDFDRYVSLNKNKFQFDECAPNDLHANLKRNKILIDFDYIPKVLETTCLDQYKNYQLPRNLYIKFFEKMCWDPDDFNLLEVTMLRLGG